MKLKIAFADDHRFVRESFAAILTLIGHEVILLAENGQVLLEHINDGNLPHVCILDGKMPKVDGYFASEIIKEHWPLIKTIIFSFDDDPVLTRKYRCSKADAFLSKTAGIDEFERVLMAIGATVQFVHEDFCIR